jgi:starch synthase/alpha-amylase
MIAPIYGALPVAHDTGGIHDTVVHLIAGRDRGNGFLFENYDAAGLFWAVTQAMDFFKLGPEARQRQVGRIMQESAASFNHANTARQYIDLYEKMLERPLIS